MEVKETPRAMLKSEYARQSGIPVSTLRYYCNEMFLAELEEIGYRKNGKYLTPKIIAWLNVHLVVTND